MANISPSPSCAAAATASSVTVNASLSRQRSPRCAPTGRAARRSLGSAAGHPLFEKHPPSRRKPLRNPTQRATRPAERLCRRRHDRATTECVRSLCVPSATAGEQPRPRCSCDRPSRPARGTRHGGAAALLLLATGHPLAREVERSSSVLRGGRGDTSDARPPGQNREDPSPARPQRPRVKLREDRQRRNTAAPRHQQVVAPPDCRPSRGPPPPWLGWLARPRSAGYVRADRPRSVPRPSAAGGAIDRDGSRSSCLTTSSTANRRNRAPPRAHRTAAPHRVLSPPESCTRPTSVALPGGARMRTCVTPSRI